MNLNIKKTGLLVLTAFYAVSPLSARTIRISIGTQDSTINCAAGGPVIKHLNLLQKYLPHDGQYKDVDYEVEWKSFQSGPPLNNELLADKLDIGMMAEFPAVLGATTFKAEGNKVRTYYIATLSGGVTGAGNAILVPAQSSVQSLADLKGKTISVPMGSTAHACLLRAIESLGWTPNRDVNIISQSPEVAGSALQANKIDAHADFVPYGELFPFQGFARKIYDGESSGLTTTHGVQVRSDFAQKYPELVVAYLKAMIEAGRLIRANPEEMSEQLQQWSGIKAEVVYAFLGPHGIQTVDYTLKPEFVAALKTAETTLQRMKRIETPINIDHFVNDRWIRQAAKEMGEDYQARLKSYDPEPFTAKDFVTGEAVTDPKLVGQLWVAGEGKVRLYCTAERMLNGSTEAERQGKKIRVAFVYDRNTGLELFADKAWYVRNGHDIAAFLAKTDAEKWGISHHGTVYNFAALKTALMSSPLAVE